MNRSESKIVALIVLFCFSLPACSGKIENSGGNGSPTNAGSNTASPFEAKGNFPQEVKDEFLKSCVGASSNAIFCTCMLDKVQSEYSLEEFTAIESQITAGNPPDEFVEFTGKARAECIKQPK